MHKNARAAEMASDPTKKPARIARIEPNRLLIKSVLPTSKTNGWVAAKALDTVPPGGPGLIQIQTGMARSQTAQTA